MTGSVHGVRSADRERGQVRSRNLVVVLGMHYWDQVISCREEGHGGQGTDVLVCVPSQERSYQKQSALHVASENGLAGTVAALLAHGANAALADKVRTCVYLRTHDDTHKQSKGMYMYE